MQRKFIFNLGLLVFLNLLVKPFYILGIDTEILDRVGQSEYGIYFALMNLSFLLNIVLDMGIVNFNTSNIAKHQQLVSKHFSTVFSIRIFLSFFYFIICLGVAAILDYTSLEMTLLVPICINQILVGFILYLRSNLAGLQLFEKDSIVSVMDRLILIIMCSAILWGNAFGFEMTIELFVYLQTAAYALTFLFAFVLLQPYLSLKRIKFNMPFNMVILRKSFPYALLILLMGFYYRTDGIMLERMLVNGAYEAGIYAQAYRFFEAGNMLAYLFGVLLFPMFSKILDNKSEVSNLLNLAFRIMIVGTLIAGLAGFFFSTEIMNLRFSSEVETSSEAFKYLMIGFTGICGTYVFGALLTASGNLKELNIMALTGVILNVVLNLILIPEYKAKGAAIASMITQLSMALIQIYLVHKVIKVQPERMTLFKLVLFIALIIFIYWPIHSTDLSWVSQILLYCFSALLLSFALKLLSMRNLFTYMSLMKTEKN